MSPSHSNRGALPNGPPRSTNEPTQAERPSKTSGPGRIEERIRFQAQLLDAIGQAVIATDLGGKIIYWNQVAEEMYGWLAKEVMGRSILEFTPSEELVERAEEIMTELMAGRSWRGEFVVRRKDGTTFPAMVTDTPVHDDRGALVAIIGVSTDITGLKQTEQLRRSEERFRSLVQNGSDIILVMKADQTVQYVSPAVERILGYKPEEVVGKDYFGVVHPDDMARAQKRVTEAVSNPGSTSSMELRLRHKVGSWCHVESRCTSLLDDPAVGGIVFNTRDVTDRREAYDRLAESERRFSAVVSNAHAYVYRCLNEPGYPNEFASDYALELTGYSSEDLLVGGKVRFGDLIVEEDRSRVWDEVQQALAERRGFELRYSIRRRDGEVRHVREHGQGVYDEDGDVVALEGLVYDVTELVEAEVRLKESEERYRTVIEEQTELVCRFLPDTTLTFVNDAYCRYFGKGPRELVGRSFLDHIPEADRVVYEKPLSRLSRANHSRTVEHRIFTPDGEIRWQQWTDRALFDEEGNLVEYLSVGRDITDRKEAEEALRKSEARLAEAQRIAHVGSWEWDVAPDTVTWSDELYRIFGRTPQEFENTYESFLRYVHPEDREFIRRTIQEAYETGRPFAFEHRVVRPDGSVRVLQSRGEVLTGENGETVRMAGTAQDVTERKALEECLEHQAFHDSLTDLPNRHLFVDRLGQALRRTGRKKGHRVAVLFMDHDDFKAINDSLGHELGDLLLVVVAQRLRRCLRPEDTLARFGGDEFVVLIEDVESPDDAVRVAERIVEGLREPFVVDGREMFLRASIGVALGTSRQKSPEDLLRDADTAMYEAKEEGLAFRVFDPAMYQRAVRRLELENDIRRAVKAEEFVLHYQPIVDLESGEVRGVEALVRWNHPERGLLDPEEFVQVSEESGLIIALGERILEEACRRVKEWQEDHPRIPPLVVTVNISARQLGRPDIARSVERVLRESGLEARYLRLDITETVYIKALEGNTQALDELRRMGVSISIDDFGTGYSSLAYLKRLPANALKVEKSFVKGIGEDLEDTAIVRMIIDLAHTLGMEVIAEGVESEEQAELLKEMGCDLAQGFHFSEPLQLDAAVRFLTEERPS
jgi:diguanylate cyclase (GGDEF)-like protein/PAS domain S-box-containing protein